MSKRAIIIHGWDGHPEEGWFPWLKLELEARGYEVTVPTMPETNHPKIEAWVSFLTEMVGTPDENTILIGHSIGCQTIVRYLETLSANVKIDRAIFVAGWFTLTLESEAEEIIAKPWLETPIDFVKVKSHTNNFFALFSGNDPVVPAENQQLFAEKLGAKIKVESNKGHFSGGDGVTTLPTVLSFL